MKVALVYDRVNKWGGAERVLLALHELFPDAPLYTSVYNTQSAGWADEFSVNSSFLQKFPMASTSHELYPLLMPIAFESFSFDEYDLVISITSEAAKGIITKPHTRHLCYCLTPTRYLWSGYDMYFTSRLTRFLSAPFIWYLRKWDKVAAKRPDLYIAISQEVKKRIKNYYGRDASLVYPPVSLGVTHLPEKKVLKIKDYFLVVSRLVPYKRVDIAVEACTKLGLPLIVIGTGTEGEKLKALAGPTITFLGNVSDDDLANYYRNANALIFPGVEDFGITMVESLAFGRPVVAFKAGGALEIIEHTKTGIFFDKQTEKSLRLALSSFKKEHFSEKILRAEASKFSSIHFKKSFMDEVKKLFANS